MNIVNLIFGAVIFTCTIYVSFNHSIYLYHIGGYIGSMAIAGVIAGEALYAMGIINTVKSLMSKIPAPISARIATIIGTLMVGWANIYAGWEKWRAEDNPIGIILGVAIMSYLWVADWIIVETLSQFLKKDKKMSTSPEASSNFATEVDTNKVDMKQVDTKVDLGKVDLDKVDIRKVDAEVDTPKLDMKVDTVKVDVPKVDIKQVDKVDVEVDTTKMDVVKVDTSKVDVAEVDAVNVDGDKLTSEKVDVDKVDAKKVDVLKVDTPEVNAKKVDVAKVDVDKVDTEVDMSKVDAEKVDAKVDVDKVDVAKVDVVEKVDVKKVDTSNVIKFPNNANLDAITLEDAMDLAKDLNPTPETLEEMKRVLEYAFQVKEEKKKFPGRKKLKQETQCNEYVAKEVARILNTLKKKQAS